MGQAMLIEDRAIFYDGRTPRPVGVTVRFSSDALDLFDDTGALAAHWQARSLRQLPASSGRLRIASRDHADARIEVSDPDSVARLLPAVARFSDGTRMSRAAIIRNTLLITGALLSVVGVIIFGIPAVAAQLAPLVPTGLETSIGAEIRPQIIRLLSHGSDKPCSDPAGLAALHKATAPLVAAAGTAFPIQIDVIDMSVPNAFALPGGSIFVLKGMLDKVAGPDELLAVLAHELGHVHNRDAMRQLLETAGLTAVISAVIGDYSGSTMSVLVGQSLIRAGYSRDVEAEADAFGVALLGRMGRNPRALGDALRQMTTGSPDPFASVPWLMDHPSTPDRIARLLAAGTDAKAEPILDANEWAALKAICR
jgi:Zn-dependent protease with chaperone function